MKLLLTNGHKELSLVVKAELCAGLRPDVKTPADIYKDIVKAIKNKFKLKNHKPFTTSGIEVTADTEIIDGQVILVLKTFDTNGIPKKYLKYGNARVAQVDIIGRELCGEDVIATIYNLAKMKNVVKVLALPDLTNASPCPVGTSVDVVGGVYPKWIGTDIGCGVTLFRIKSKSLNIERLRKKCIVGYTDKWEAPGGYNFRKTFHPEDKVGEIDLSQYDSEMGSIGGGNHFCELQESDSQGLCLCVHSGSRTLGVAIHNLFKEEFLEDPEDFLRYQAIGIEWARNNRRAIAERFCGAIGLQIENVVTDLCHNFIERDNNVYVHRKGSIPNRGLAMIPGSRGTNSYLVKRKPDSTLTSLPHGAGRRLGRKTAENRFSKQHDSEPSVICRNKKLHAQEAPGAYKDIDSVIETLQDNIEIVGVFKPLLTYKC